MSNAINPVNFTFTDQSPLFQYAPSRETTADQGWISAYSGSDPAVYKPETFGSGTSSHSTTSTQSSVTLQFSGTAVYLSGSATDSKSYSITLDNKNVDAFPNGGYLFTQSNLNNGAHTLTLSVNSGTVVVSQAIVTTAVGLPGADVKQTTTNFTGTSLAQTPSVIKFGDKSQWQAQLDFDGQQYPRISTNTPSASLTFSVSSASAFAFYGSTNWNHDSYKVQLTGTDGTSMIQNLDGLTKYVSMNQLLFLATGLDNTQQYTVSVQNTATKTSVFFDIASFTIYDAVGGSAPASTTSKPIKSAAPSSTFSQSTTAAAASSSAAPSSSAGVSTGGIIGIAVGAIAILAVGLALLMYARKKNTKRRGDDDDGLRMNEGTWDPPTDPQHEIRPFTNYNNNSYNPFQTSEYNVLNSGAPATLGTYAQTQHQRPLASQASSYNDDRQSTIYGDNASDAYATDAMFAPSVAPSSAQPYQNFNHPPPIAPTPPPAHAPLPPAPVASSSRTYPQDSKKRILMVENSTEDLGPDPTHDQDAGPALPPMYNPTWADQRRM